MSAVDRPGMKAVLVVSNAAHGKALMRWSCYGEAQWDVVKYGDVLSQDYAIAVLARPIGDISDDHALWVSHILRPRVIGRLSTMAGWTLDVVAPLAIEDMRDEVPASRDAAVG